VPPGRTMLRFLAAALLLQTCIGFDWKCVNYYASTHGWIDQWCAGWSAALTSEIDQELALARSLNANTIRTFIQFSAVESGCSGNATADQVLDRLNVVIRL